MTFARLWRHSPGRLLLLLLFLVAGCSGCAGLTGKIKPAAITGDWLAQESLPAHRQAVTRMQIRPDGSFSGSLQVTGEPTWTFSGHWTLAGNSIHWVYTQSSFVLLVDDQSETDTIVDLQPDRIQLRSSRHQEVRTLTRVR